ncbi:hypothetical protein Bpfe_014485 [Biomphalaria pfeifferi]|uniref:Uncharacterized protein n=1 Tax=Biomphalaria pfeifferi TaxID=112525 RepID=A0AAD8BK51_BIOPF|nr:hypothetical protein Bpfe_014485 [Biomphalaria pfeifferi]
MEFEDVKVVPKAHESFEGHKTQDQSKEFTGEYEIQVYEGLEVAHYDKDVLFRSFMFDGSKSVVNIVLFLLFTVICWGVAVSNISVNPLLHCME